MEAQIHEKSAWSCSHGVGRWFTRLRLQQRRAARLEPALARSRSATRWTGCAMNSPRAYEAEAAKLLNDPWAARNDYIAADARPLG